jgi:putative membrane protein
MAAVENGGALTAAPARRAGGAPAYAAMLALGALLWWLSANHPALMPVWAPWEFSPTVYLATALALFWFWRGVALTPRSERPAAWRQVAFVLGVGLVYAVLQTRFEYWSQHMFFLNRIQHVAMHHIGPFLIALGAAGSGIGRGLPARLRRALKAPAIGAAMRVVQQPLVAAFLFVGSFYFWLIPPIHFRAMLDPRLYAVMNWTMVLDGLLFWWLVLDPRPCPPARVSYGARAALSFGVMFPQIALGAIIAFSPRDLYPYYNLCGRLMPSIGALADQHIGGIIIWIPPAMMSVIGMLVVIGALRRHEDATIETSQEGAAIAELAKRWTGR